jgi:hypothetical protein
MVRGPLRICVNVVLGASVELQMLVRVAVVFACSLAAVSAVAEELRPEEARAFVVGKLFAYTCFDGTAGVARMHPDGSVVGTVRPRGQGAVRFAALPAGTVKVSANAVCAHVPGLPVEPCFKVNRIDHRTFRGSLTSLGFAYCDFALRSTSRPHIATNVSPPMPITKVEDRVLPPATVTEDTPNENE